MLTPDDVLLRRFGYVRAIGGAAYFVACAVLFALYGAQVWPLLLGLPVLAVVTTWYFVRSHRYPRTAVGVSLIADALVLGGAVAFVGGTGSGLVTVYTIVIVSAGILLGPNAARAFAGGCGLLGLAQLGMEQLGFEPALLYNPDLGERVPILALSLGVLASIGYLTGIYASRLHELIVEAGAQAEAVRHRGRRHRSLIETAAVEVEQPLRELDAVAEILERGELADDDRARLAQRLRSAITGIDSEVGRIADVGTFDVESPPQPVRQPRVVDGVLAVLRRRRDGYGVDVDVPPMKVVGNRRAARRVVYSLLENVVEHTPRGTNVRVTAVATAGHGVLVVVDDGPGIDEEAAAHLFDPPGGSAPRVGLPLVAELCAGMGAECRYEPAPGGGSRFLVAFRLAPSGAPTPDDEHPSQAPEAGLGLADGGARGLARPDAGERRFDRPDAAGR
jgi:two-component system, OmpR family, sensor kinase